MSEALDVVRRFVAAAQADDWATIESIFDASAPLHQAPSMPYGGTWYGPEGMRTCNATLVDTWADLDQLDPPRYLDAGPSDDGDIVVLLTTMRSRIKGGDRLLEIPIVEIYRVRDGQIVEIRPFYWDTAAVADECARVTEKTG